MTTFQIEDAELTGLEGKVVVVTGGSSGIGLATVDLLMALGALVVSGDVQAPQETDGFLFVQTDVNSWIDLVKLFKAARKKHGRIDHVFANAGIGPRAELLNLDLDEHGDPKQPNNITLETNLQGVVNTTTLAVHYLKSQSEGGSIVLTGSSTGLHPVRAVDYATAKSGVLGLGRSFARLVEAERLPIRINTLAPSWTATQVMPNMKDRLRAVSADCQSPLVVARAAAYLFANQHRSGETVFVGDGKYVEIEKAVLAPAYESIKGDTLSDDAILAKLRALYP